MTIQRKLTPAIIILIFFQTSLIKAQETPDTNNKVVVNKEMIERFNQCDTEGKLISWSDLVMGFDSQSLQDLYLAYQTSDLENQTLEEIKLALESKQTEHLSNSNIYSNLAWFNQVKQEINNKLRVTDMVVQK